MVTCNLRYTSCTPFRCTFWCRTPVQKLYWMPISLEWTCLCHMLCQFCIIIQYELSIQYKTVTFKPVSIVFVNFLYRFTIVMASMWHLIASIANSLLPVRVLFQTVSFLLLLPIKHKQRLKAYIEIHTTTYKSLSSHEIRTWIINYIWQKNMIVVTNPRHDLGYTFSRFLHIAVYCDIQLVSTLCDLRTGQLWALPRTSHQKSHAFSMSVTTLGKQTQFPSCLLWDDVWFAGVVMLAVYATRMMEEVICGKFGSGLEIILDLHG